MANYSAPLRDMQFVLHELLGVEEILKSMPPHADMDGDTINAILEEGGKFCTDVLLPLNQVGDQEGCTYEGDGVVKTPTGFKEAYDLYSHKLVPQIGKAIANDEDSYRYLVESIRRFPDMPGFERMIRDAGFENTRVEPIMGGLVAIHSGWKV